MRPIAAGNVRLLLARHGRTAWNLLGRFQGQSDVPLDEVGRAQAAALADVLRGRVQAVLASDLLRASETARIVAEALELPLLGVDVDLRERCNGVFEGLTREECIAQHPELWAAREADRNFLTPGSESREQVSVRMQRALDRVVAQLDGRYHTVLVVSHGAAMRMFLEALTGQSQVEPIANTELRELLHDGTCFSYLPRVPG